MTKFWRQGHYRTSIKGARHWVSGHEVKRDNLNYGINHLGPFCAATPHLCNVMDDRKSLWVSIQISLLDKNYQMLDHLAKYKGIYGRIVEYFINIYDDIHEEWMQSLKNDYGLPYPQTPDDDWFIKFKGEQEKLEKEWKG